MYAHSAAYRFVAAYNKTNSHSSGMNFVRNPPPGFCGFIVYPNSLRDGKIGKAREHDPSSVRQLLLFKKG
jgi:hypothetical protein